MTEVVFFETKFLAAEMCKEFCGHLGFSVAHFKQVLVHGSGYANECVIDLTDEVYLSNQVMNEGYLLKGESEAAKEWMEKAEQDGRELAQENQWPSRDQLGTKPCFHVASKEYLLPLLVGYDDRGAIGRLIELKLIEDRSAFKEGRKLSYNIVKQIRTLRAVPSQFDFHKPAFTIEEVENYFNVSRSAISPILKNISHQDKDYTPSYD